MAYNDKKILQILFDEANKIPERCNDYNAGIAHLIREILQLEQSHKISKMDIKKQIAKHIHRAGMDLHKMLSSNNNDKDAQ